MTWGYVAVIKEADLLPSPGDLSQLREEGLGVSQLLTFGQKLGLLPFSSPVIDSREGYYGEALGKSTEAFKLPFCKPDLLGLGQV